MCRKLVGDHLKLYAWLVTFLKEKIAFQRSFLAFEILQILVSKPSDIIKKSVVG